MKKLVLGLLLLGGYFMGYAQVGIGIKDPSTSAMLDVHSPNGDKGILMPKIALVEKSSFAPIKGNSSDVHNLGLIIYNTTVDTTKDLIQGYYYWTGSKWTGLPNTETVIELISNQIVNGGVYYGKINGGTKEVLYLKKIDAVTGTEINEEIDILSLLINNLTVENIFKLKEAMGYDVTEQVVYTGKSVKGKYHYSVYGKTQIEDGNAEAGGVSLSAETLRLLEEGVIYKVYVLNNNHQIIDINTTDIVVTNAGVLKFSLGANSLYYTLPAGEYGVIVELLSSKEQI